MKVTRVTKIILTPYTRDVTHLQHKQTLRRMSNDSLDENRPTPAEETSSRNTAAIAASRKLFVLILSFSLLKFSFQVGLSRDLEEVNRQDGRLLFPVGRHQERLGRGHQKSVSPFVILI